SRVLRIVVLNGVVRILGKVFRNGSFTQKNGPPFPKGGPFLTLSRRSEYQCLSYYARPSAKALFIWFDLSPAGKISSLLWKSPSFYYSSYPLTTFTSLP